VIACEHAVDGERNGFVSFSLIYVLFINVLLLLLLLLLRENK